jgi:hypothetical protein
MVFIFALLPDMVLFAVSTFSFGLVVSIVLFFSYWQVRKKGYRPPAASAVLLAGCALGIAGAVAEHRSEAWIAETDLIAQPYQVG